MRALGVVVVVMILVLAPASVLVLVLVLVALILSCFAPRVACSAVGRPGVAVFVVVLVVLVIVLVIVVLVVQGIDAPVGSECAGRKYSHDHQYSC